jgi:hypothetical protein
MSPNLSNATARRQALEQNFKYAKFALQAAAANA